MRHVGTKPPTRGMDQTRRSSGARERRRTGINMMTYKGYVGRIAYDDENELFHGEVVNIRDVVTFQGTTVRELKRAFRESVDDYLNFCAERGEPPEKPLSGKFMVRIDPEVHRTVFLAAKRRNMSVNAWVAKALAKEADNELNGV